MTDVATVDGNIISGILPPPLSALRLIQCSRCSLPLRRPLRLPCGNTFCRSCLPPIHKRVGISYPMAEARENGFTCYWEGVSGCVGEHCVGDCATDVLLTKVVALYEEVFAGFARGDALSAEQTTAIPHSLDPDSAESEAGRHDDLEGLYRSMREGRLDGLETMTSQKSQNKKTMMVMMRMRMAAKQSPKCSRPSQDMDEPYDFGEVSTSARDEAVLEKLKQVLRVELDCQVCYSLILDPITTPCGHTFCQKCIGRVLDHSDLCPICRRKLNLPPVVDREPLNKRLAELISTFFPDQIAERRETIAQDESGLDNDRKLPLFVCTLSFPTMPTFLHIFEPRYRLMIRRVMESGASTFGMVMYNRSSRLDDGEASSSLPFMQYGTLLKVDRFELLPDGRSLVVATGLTRFKVIESGIFDGYQVGRVERVDDVSLTEEETLESMETSTSSSTAAGTQSSGSGSESPLSAMSTQQLLQLCLDFVHSQQAEGASWLDARVLLAYGQAPSDPARFPWWFASVLPMPLQEKYALLSTTTVRDRLKITARWVRKLESRDW